MLTAALVVLACLGCASAAPPPASSASPAPPSPAAASPASAPAVAPSSASAPAVAPSSAPPAAPTATPASAASPTTAASAAPGARSGADAIDDGPKQWLHGEEINWSRQVLTTIIWLGLMCGGIWLILRIMYGRLGLGALAGGGPRRNIQVLDRHMLGPQKALLVVAVPGKVLLLGMTEQNITTLAEIAPEEMEMAGATPLPLQGPVSVRAVEKPPGFEAPPDNLVDLAGLFGRRGAQTNKGEDQE